IASPDPLRRSYGSKRSPLDLAEERLAQHDAVSAARIARQSLDDNNDDPARALFILARAALLEKNAEEARLLLERTLQVARDPQIIAWSHIYLGRIYDYQPEPNRGKAVEHYKAALSAGDTSPAVKQAADKGLEAPPRREVKK